MIGSSGISDNFIVQFNVRYRLTVKWQNKKITANKINNEPLTNFVKQYEKKLNDILKLIYGQNSLNENREKTKLIVRKAAEYNLEFQEKR